MDDFKCPLCQKILLKPITVSCGHTFCKHCLHRPSNSKQRCPVCNSNFQLSPNDRPNILIQSLIEKRFPKEFKKRSRETPREEVKRSVNSIPLYLKQNLILYPGAIGVITNPENRYFAMIQNAMMGNRLFGMLSSYNGRWIGALLEITSLDTNNPHSVIVHVHARERFLVESVFPDQDETQMIDVNSIGHLELNNESLYWGIPIFIRDDLSAEPAIKDEVLAFVESCLNLLEIDEQRAMRELFLHNCDKSFYAISMLNIPQEDMLAAYLSTHKAERYEICKRFITAKRIAKEHVRAPKENLFKTHFGTIMIVLALLIVIFFGRK